MSPRYCCVRGCFKNNGTHKDLSFFRFPRDPIRCSLWIKNCQREDLINLPPNSLHSAYVVCSLHFEEEMFSLSKNRIRKTAVPTLFDFEKIIGASVSRHRRKISKGSTTRASTDGLNPSKVKTGKELRMTSDLDINPHTVDLKKSLTLHFGEAETEGREYSTDTKVNIEKVDFAETSVEKHEPDMIIKTEEIDIKVESCDSSDNGLIPGLPGPEAGQFDGDPSTSSHFCHQCKCTYHTKSQHYLKCHLDTSHVIMRKCKYCSCETMHTTTFNNHILTHDGNPELCKFR